MNNTSTDNFKKILQGKAGYTPIKGVDYFTANEIQSIISFIESNIRVPNDGQKGERGEAIKGDKGKDGKNGITPVLGYDYWTSAEV
jgi:hypothetical protein